VNCFGFFLTLRFSAAPLFCVCYHSSQWYIYTYISGVCSFIWGGHYELPCHKGWLLSFLLIFLFFFWKKEFSMIRQLLTVDLLARASMKNAANCDT